MICCSGFGKCHCQTMIENTCARWGSSVTRPAVRCCSSFRDFSMQRRENEDLRANKPKLSRMLSAKRRSTCFTFLRFICWSRVFPLKQGRNLFRGLLKFGDKGALSLELGKKCLGKTGRRRGLENFDVACEEGASIDTGTAFLSSISFLDFCLQESFPRGRCSTAVLCSCPTAHQWPRQSLKREA